MLECQSNLLMLIYDKMIVETLILHCHLMCNLLTQSRKVVRDKAERIFFTFEKICQRAHHSHIITP